MFDRGRETPVWGTPSLPETSKKREFDRACSCRAGTPPPKGHAVMISKGNLLRLVVSLAALASLASLGGGYFDGH